MPRKNTRRRRRNRRTKMIMPDRYKCKLKYSEQVQLTGTAGSWYNFRGNGLFDPNESGTGTQPLGFDELNNFYDQHLVTSAVIKIEAANIASTGTPGNVYFTVLPTTQDQDSRIGIERISCSDHSVSKLLVPVSAGGNPITIKKFMSTKQMYKAFDSSDAIFAGNESGSPSAQWYFHIECTPLDLSGIIDVWLNVTITYYCEFFDKKILPIS